MNFVLQGGALTPTTTNLVCLFRYTVCFGGVIDLLDYNKNAVNNALYLI